MNLFTTISLGPIRGAARNLEVAWTSSPSPQGTRGASISVYLPTWQAEQVSELVANRDRRITVAGETGVLEPIYFDSSMASHFDGWYLLQSASFEPYGTGAWATHTPVKVSGVHLGSRQPVVTRSARARTNSWSVTAKAMVADPFYGDGFVSSPGGTLVTADYDPEPFDMARVATSAATMNRYIAAPASLAEVILCSPGD